MKFVVGELLRCDENIVFGFFCSLRAVVDRAHVTGLSDRDLALKMVCGFRILTLSEPLRQRQEALPHVVRTQLSR